MALQHWAKRRLFQSQHNDLVGQIEWKCCHWLCWSLCDESLLCGFGNWEIWWKYDGKWSMKNRKCFWLNDGRVAFLCSKNRVDVQCLELTIPWGGPAAWISSTLFLQTQDLGQDGEQSALGAGVCNRARVPVLRVLLHHRLPPASCPPRSAWLPFPCYKKSSNPKTNLGVCSDTNNNEEFAKVPKWVFFYFGGSCGFLVFFVLVYVLTLPPLFGSFLLSVSNKKKVLNYCYLRFVCPA